MMRMDFEAYKTQLISDLNMVCCAEDISRASATVNLLLAEVVNDLVCVLRRTHTLLAEPDAVAVIRREKEAKDISDVVQLEAEAGELTHGGDPDPSETLDERQFAAVIK